MKKALLLSVIAAVMLQPVFGNYAFYKKISNTCSSYRIKINDRNMHMNGTVFTVELASKRNDFEMVMLVGFAAVGQAIIHQRELALSKPDFTPMIPEKIEIAVNVPLGRNETIITAIAPAKLVEELADGSLEASEFMRQIKDSISSH